MTDPVNNKSADRKEPKLFLVDEKTYGEDYKEHLLEQYKLCVGAADMISDRRSASNTFYLTLISALIALIGVLSQVNKPISALYFWWVALVSLSGIMFCLLWNTSIDCYRQINQAKYKVINEIEERLPAAAFAKEWSYLKAENKKAKYPELTLVERWIPVMFLVLFLILLIISLIMANYALIAKFLT